MIVSKELFIVKQIVIDHHLFDSERAVFIAAHKLFIRLCVHPKGAPLINGLLPAEKTSLCDRNFHSYLVHHSITSVWSDYITDGFVFQ